jgi:hypothetical protein
MAEYDFQQLESFLEGERFSVTDFQSAAPVGGVTLEMCNCDDHDFVVVDEIENRVGEFGNQTPTHG